MVRDISAERLAERLDRNESFALVDTRDAESYETWRVPGARHFPFGSDEALDGRLDDVRELVGDVETVVAICAEGITSSAFADELDRVSDEYDVEAVTDGMRAWSRVYDVATVEVGDGVIVRQVQRRAKGCLGYVIGDTVTGAALVVDPTRDHGTFRSTAVEVGLTVAGILDTHVHADHVSGGPALADELDVPYYLGEHASAERDVTVDHEPLAANEVIEVGELPVKALFTPGHTSEMIAPLIDDVAICTADSLHVDSTGRTELEFGEDEGERGARLLYESLHRTILALPESVAVLPGHVDVGPDGRFRTGRPGDPIATTVGEARTSIEALSMGTDAFVERLADAGEKPANFEEIIAINRGDRSVDDEQRLELEMGPNNCSA